MQAPYPVHYVIEPPGRFSRLQLLIRFAAFCAIGLLGLSFGAVFLFAYLALPAFAASRLSSQRGLAGAYVDDDGPRVIKALHWFAAISAWTGLIAEQLPSRADEAIRLELDGKARPTARSAILRIFTGLPSALVLVFLCWIGAFVWLWAALTILFVQRVGHGAFWYLAGLQRWSARLLAYQASLVDDYPPFSFEEHGTSSGLAAAGSRP